MRRWPATAVISALISCSLPNETGRSYDINGRDLGATNRHEILATASMISVVGDIDPIQKREAATLVDRYREWLTVRSGFQVAYSKLNVSEFRGNQLNLDSLLYDADDWEKKWGVHFDKSRKKTRGQIEYLIGSSSNRTCIIFRSYFGDHHGVTQGLGDKEIIGSNCRPDVPGAAELNERETFELLDRLRFDDGAINRTRAAGSPPPVVKVVSPPTPPPPAPQPTAAPQPPVPPTSVAQPQPPDQVADRLRKLKSLYDLGLVSHEEYEARRKAILDGL